MLNGKLNFSAIKSGFFLFISTFILLIIAGVQTVNAAAVNISGSGSWDSTAPTTDFSAPDTSWSFSFDLLNPISSNPTNEFSNFEYYLGGSLVTSPALVSVEFFDASLNGLFDLIFSGDIRVSMYGDDIGSDLSIELGTFVALSAMDQDDSTGSGTVIVSAVPEPATLALFGLGLAGIPFVRRRRTPA